MVMSFAEAADYFANLAIDVEAVIPEMAMAGALIIQQEIKAELGHYQPSVGPYNAWQQLADATEERRTKAGFAPDDPLLMSGHLRDSIQIVETDDVVFVGTNVHYAKDLEFGTITMPPRPFIARAAFVKQDEILEVQAAILGDLFGL